MGDRKGRKEREGGDEREGQRVYTMRTAIF